MRCDFDFPSLLTATFPLSSTTLDGVLGWFSWKNYWMWKQNREPSKWNPTKQEMQKAFLIFQQFFFFISPIFQLILDLEILCEIFSGDNVGEEIANLFQVFLFFLDLI